MARRRQSRSGNKRDAALKAATRRKLKLQAGWSVVGTAAAGIWLLPTKPWVWLYYVGVMAFAGLLLVYGARRGIAYPLCRALGSLVFFGILGGGMLYIYHLATPRETQGVVFLTTAAGILLSVAVYFFWWDVPHWRDTYERNLQRKIDLKRGLFSVTVEWARRKPLPVGFGSLVFALGLAGAGIGSIITKMFGPVAILLPGAFLVWAAIAFCLTELYNAYQLRRIERMIGRPLIIDAYADEFGR